MSYYRPQNDAPPASKVGLPKCVSPPVKYYLQKSIESIQFPFHDNITTATEWLIIQWKENPLINLLLISNLEQSFTSQMNEPRAPPARGGFSCS